LSTGIFWKDIFAVFQQTTTIQSIADGQNQVPPYIFFFKKLFHSDIHHNREEKTMPTLNPSSWPSSLVILFNLCVSSHAKFSHKISAGIPTGAYVFVLMLMNQDYFE